MTKKEIINDRKYVSQKLLNAQELKSLGKLLNAVVKNIEVMYGDDDVLNLILIDDVLMYHNNEKWQVVTAKQINNWQKEK